MSADLLSPVPGGVNRVDHVGVIVPDASKALAQFGSALGLTVDDDEVLDEVGVRLVYLVGRDGPGHCDLQLVEPLRDGPLRAHLVERGEGLHHVCFITNSIDEALAAARDGQAKPFQGGKGRRACFLHENVSGVLVELIEPSSAAIGH
jgi:methylmalonyl-CoA/ethylmalonyl-CoA epimerase